MNEYKKWAILGLFFFIFVFSIQLTVNIQWLDSNRGPLESEATALPTEPPLLPNMNEYMLQVLWRLNWGKNISQTVSRWRFLNLIFQRRREVANPCAPPASAASRNGRYFDVTAARAFRQAEVWAHVRLELIECV